MMRGGSVPLPEKPVLRPARDGRAHTSGETLSFVFTVSFVRVNHSPAKRNGAVIYASCVLRGFGTQENGKRKNSQNCNKCVLA